MPVYGPSQLRQLSRIMLKPFRFNNMTVTVVDVLHAEHPRDWVYVEHQDVWFEFCYVCKGSVYTTLAGKEFRINAGEAYIVPPMVSHSHRNCDNIGDDGYCIRFNVTLRHPGSEANPWNASAQELLGHLRMLRPYGFPFEGDRFIKSLDGLSEMGIQLKFLEFLLSLDVVRQQEFQEETYIPEEEGALLSKKIILYMKEYHGAGFSVVDMAKSFHLSYRHLSRVFRKATGDTIVHKLNEIRIEHAKKLLRETDLLIKDIASVVGIDNQYYFSKLFCEYEHMSPSQYKNASGK